LLRYVLAAALCLAALSAHAQDVDAGWRTYGNARFGVWLDYPDVFATADPEPANGDGRRFRTADGAASLTIYGAYNVNHQSARELMQAYRTQGVDYAYAQAGPAWFVLSGTKQGTIGYLRCHLGDGDVVGCFDLEYPKADRLRWDPIVARLSRGLRLRPVETR
jgi:hypothetical protein